MKFPTLCCFAVLSAAMAAAPLAHAQSDPAGSTSAQTTAEPATPVANAPHPIPAEKNWRFGVGLGYGQRTNPLIQSEDIPVVVDLDIAWFGERWFFDNFDLGFALVDNSRFTANVVARLNSDRAFFGKTNTRYVNFTITSGGEQVPIAAPPGPADSPDQGIVEPVQLKVPDRDYAVELGLEMLFDGEWGHATLRAFHDVSNTHEGYEISADYSYRWVRGRFTIAPSVGVAYKSAELSDYYWGVHADEVLPTLQGYQVDGGIGWEAGLRTSYYITKSMRVAVSANYEQLTHNIALSPLVAEPYVIGYFAGLAWQF
jgi:outer membrane protein